MNRRSFMQAILVAGVSPAVIRYANLMPVRAGAGLMLLDVAPFSLRLLQAGDDTGIWQIVSGGRVLYEHHLLSHGLAGWVAPLGHEIVTAAGLITNATFSGHEHAYLTYIDRQGNRQMIASGDPYPGSGSV